MSQPPNILFLMTDQMQARVLDPASPCRTPCLDRLIARGLRFTRAYTPNAVCSPARASLMTGLLPHSHGVLQVTHCVDDDQAQLRTEHPHWAQRLAEAGYRTGYFGKWHVERSNDLGRFGWQVNGVGGGALWNEHSRRVIGANPVPQGDHPARWFENPPGYKRMLFWGATDAPMEQRGAGLATGMALSFLQEAVRGGQPWCAFVSVQEPHDPFVCGAQALSQCDPAAIELPVNCSDPLTDKPGLYRKAAQVFAHLSEDDKRQATAHYWALISEIDQQFGRLLAFLESAGQLERTIIVLSTDHGEMLGSHGLYMKNVGAFEEVYNIPLVIAGPGVARGVATEARVGLHDVAATLCDLAGVETVGRGQSRSFRSVLADPRSAAADFTTGYAEYFGTRYWLTQRIIWDGPWKLVWNGFDFDELYHLEQDPGEMTNRIHDPDCRPVVRRLMTLAWQRVRDTNDHALGRSHYPVLRLAECGPEI